MTTSEHNGSAIRLPTSIRSPTTAAARVVERCDRLAVERAKTLERAQKEDGARKSLAEEIVEELEDELAAVAGRAAPGSRKVASRAEVIGAAWWRGHEVLTARLDLAHLDDTERDALGLLIGLECGARVASEGVHDKNCEDEDLQAPLRLMRLVEIGHAGSLARDRLSADSRLAKAGLITSTWRTNRRSDAPYLALRPHPRFLGELGELSDTFGWPRPWVRVEGPRESLDDLIVGSALRAEIDEIVSLARHALGGRRGLQLEYGRGFCVLLHGPAGTGKTLAARAIARSLDVPLACYDRARASELGLGDEHVSRLLESWRPKDGVLFIDEVDDLLDDLRRGNSNSLLLGLEAFEGVLLFATNRTVEVRDSLDRRIQRVVSFSYPDAECRQRLIRAHVPQTVPLDEDSLRSLSRHVISGGLIKNAVLEATALCELRDAPIDVATLDAALHRQNRAAHRPPEEDVLLRRLLAEKVEGLDAALAVLRHAMHVDGATVRARLGLSEPVIDIIAPVGVATVLVDAVATSLELALVHATSRRRPGRARDDDDGEMNHGPAAFVVFDGDEEFCGPRALAVKARRAHAHVAFRVLRHEDTNADDPADVTVRVRATDAPGIARALLEERVAAAGLLVEDGALAALELAAGAANLALALRIVGAAVAAGHRRLTPGLVETLTALFRPAVTRGLFGE